METKINNSQKNRYKFVFGDKPLTLTTDKDNLFMEEIERVATEKYEAIKEKLPNADNETIAILMAINALSVQLSREIDIEKMEDELNKRQSKLRLLSFQTIILNSIHLSPFYCGKVSQEHVIYIRHACLKNFVGLKCVNYI